MVNGRRRRQLADRIAVADVPRRLRKRRAVQVQGEDNRADDLRPLRRVGGINGRHGRRDRRRPATEHISFPRHFRRNQRIAELHVSALAALAVVCVKKDVYRLRRPVRVEGRVLLHVLVVIDLRAAAGRRVPTVEVIAHPGRCRQLANGRGEGIHLPRSLSDGTAVRVERHGEDSMVDYHEVGVAILEHGGIQRALERDRHRRLLEVSAVRERLLPDVRHAVWDYDLLKARAAGKHPFANGQHAVLYREARQIDAAGKRIVADHRHGGRYRRLRQGGTVVERALPDACHTILHRKVRQGGAAVERIIPDFRDGGRYVHLRQRGTVEERTVPDGCHAIGYRHARDGRAAIERVGPNSRHLVV